MTRILAIAAVVVVAGCSTTTYNIPQSELARLAAVPPPERGQHVRVVQQLTDDDLGPVQPVTETTQIVVFPGPIEEPDRHRWGGNINTGGGGWGSRPSGGGGGHAGHGGGSSLHLGGGGGDGKAEAIAILAAAALVLVIDAAVEGSRFDGYAQLHPMHPVYLVGKDGTSTVLPLAWIDPQTAQWADHGVVRSIEGPWRPLERAPLDRAGFTYAVLGGLGSYKSVDSTVAEGPAFAIQFGYFFDQRVGLVGNVFLGWRDNAIGQTLFDSRYTLEVHGYPVQLGRLHLGLYGGGGAAYRWEDYGPNTYGDEGTTALVGGALVQLDVNTRIALTGRLGLTYAHDETMNDMMFGLSVY